ncbi:ATP-binding protein [Streptomyces sp. NPDC048270]|uniref:ATP-binding protein n=1 Tax=Streptomyces sp. NPDC048270 TaxID=3154615 RepID=UPI0033FAE993
MNAIPAAHPSERPRRGPLPPPRADHYLSLPDAHVMGTVALKETLANLGEVIAARGMMCVYGAAGLGKTMSVNASLRELAPGATRRIEFRGRPTVLDIRHNLFNVLDLPGRPPRQPTAFDTLLKDVLADQFRVLVCDEAQWLREESFEYFRHLFDDLYTDIAVVFVGGGNTYEVLAAKDPMTFCTATTWPPTASSAPGPRSPTTWGAPFRPPSVLRSTGTCCAGSSANSAAAPGHEHSRTRPPHLPAAPWRRR